VNTIAAFTLMAVCSTPGVMAADVAIQDPPAQQRPVATTGRVVATVTVLEGTVQIAGVDVELIAIEGNAVLGKTI
jgi:hypothetical protein